jgi:hypothetical protein
MLKTFDSSVSQMHKGSGFEIKDKKGKCRKLLSF